MTTGRINQVAALAKRTGRSPPCATALPGDACFVVSRSKQKRLATRPVGARPVPRPRAHQAGNSLSSKPTRGSSRGYQSTIRNTACSIAERAAFRRLPRHASRRPPVARSQASPERESLRSPPGSRGHRSIPSWNTVCASRIRTSQPSARALRPKPGPAPAETHAFPLPLTAAQSGRRAHCCGCTRVRCSQAPRRAGARCHSSDYWARETDQPKLDRWLAVPVGTVTPEPVAGKVRNRSNRAACSGSRPSPAARLLLSLLRQRRPHRVPGVRARRGATVASVTPAQYSTVTPRRQRHSLSDRLCAPATPRRAPPDGLRARSNAWLRRAARLEPTCMCPAATCCGRTNGHTCLVYPHLYQSSYFEVRVRRARNLAEHSSAWGLTLENADAGRSPRPRIRTAPLRPTVRLAPPRGRVVVPCCTLYYRSR